MRVFNIIKTQRDFAEWSLYWILLKIFRIRHDIGIPLVKNTV